MSQSRTRRSWRWALAPAAFLLLAGCPGGGEKPDVEPTPTAAAMTTPTPGPGTTGFVRREINTLTAAQIDAYRKGVALMQSRGADDPTSWTYQANMHGFPTNNAICSVTPGPVQPQWSTCQHGSFFFLAWHRMYLYYFEKILRAAVREATSDPAADFALPFWDYENPDNHDLPEPLRNPANNTNPLWVAQRASNCNSGAECVSAEEASDTDALALTDFCSGSGAGASGCMTGISSDESFAGGFIAAPNHSASFPGELELQPHGVVHNAVGGPTGWMSYFTCAARDPVFWLHHANIDRLWQVWLNQGGGRANPLGNDEWKTQVFTFFDETGTAKQLTGCQILNTLSQLDYQYDGVPVNNVPLCDGEAPAAPAGPAPTPPGPPKMLAQGKAAQVELARAPVSVTVALPKPAADRMLAVAGPAEPGRLQLVIEGLRQMRPGVPYQVYLNLPEGAAPDPKGPSFVGHVSIFADSDHPADITRTFDITDEVQELQAAGRWGGELRVTFVPAHTADVMAAAPQGGAFVRFKKVSVRERP